MQQQFELLQKNIMVKLYEQIHTNNTIDLLMKYEFVSMQIYTKNSLLNKICNTYKSSSVQGMACIYGWIKEICDLI